MGLTSTLYSGLSGLDANGMQFEVIGNNIANVNTTGFKAKRVLFQTQFSKTLGIGSAATSGFGGTNPSQVGLGTTIANIDTDFSPGSVETTGINSDLAIDGNGFFVVKDQSGQPLYTRNGTFTVNNRGELVTTAGYFVQGYQIDNDFNVIPGATDNLNIPLGFLTIARATDNAVIQGNLNSGGTAAANGTVLTSMALETSLGAAINDNTLMTDVCSASNPGVPLFAVGDVVTIEGVVGGRRQAIATFTVNATSRIGNSALTTADNRFTTFLQSAMGIDSDATLPQPGSVSIVGSAIRITGNSGLQNAVTLSNTALRVNTTDAPLTWVESQAADGESVFTSYTVYDSLGSPLVMNLTFVLEDAASNGTTWRFYATSADDTDINLLLGNGTVTFDTEGQYVTSTGTDISIDRTNTGAVTPQAVHIDLTTMTSLSAKTSEIALSSQDGVPIGTLSGFGVGDDGIITGTFTNGLTRTMGQIVLATFANPDGLLEAGGSNYTVGPNSGVAVIGAPLSMSAGSLKSGSLELSNVDLSKEFVNLITTSTGFSANSRVISTADEMMREILSMVR